MQHREQGKNALYMASEAVVKKRGRPKKIEAVVVVQPAATEATVTTSIGTKTRKPRAKESSISRILTDPAPDAASSKSFPASKGPKLAKKSKTSEIGKAVSPPSLTSHVKNTSTEAESPIIQAANAFSKPNEVNINPEFASATTNIPDVDVVVNSAVPSKAPDILSKLGLDTEHGTNEANARQEARQIELVELMIQAKRRKLISSISARLNQMVEERIATATTINDLRISRAANDMVSIATGIGARRSNAQAQTRTRNPPTSTTSSVSTKPSPTQVLRNNVHASSPAPPSRRAGFTQPAPQRLRPSDPIQRTGPPRIPMKRPTEMSYEELRKTPEFKRLSWSWTGIIVGVPVLLVTSWVMWKDYNRRMMERKLGLDGSLARGSVVAGGNVVNERTGSDQ